MFLFLGSGGGQIKFLFSKTKHCNKKLQGHFYCACSAWFRGFAATLRIKLQVMQNNIRSNEYTAYIILRKQSIRKVLALFCSNTYSFIILLMNFMLHVEMKWVVSHFKMRLLGLESIIKQIKNKEGNIIGLFEEKDKSPNPHLEVLLGVR